MVRSSVVFLTLASACLAQTPKEAPPLPPADVDRALRARVQEFFQYHVTGEFRKAEALVAEDTKDLFYNRNKPRYMKFVEIARIDYRENFTKATATVMMVSPEMLAGWAGGPPQVPIPSNWKIEDGKWCYYLEPESFIRTPFGSIPLNTISKASPGAPGMFPANLAPNGVSPLGPAGLPAAGMPDVNQILAGPLPAGVAPVAAPPVATPPTAVPPAGGIDPGALAAIAGAQQLGMSAAGIPGAVPSEALGKIQPDKTGIVLTVGTPQKISFHNSAVDLRSLILLGGIPSVTTKFDRTAVTPGENAELTLEAAKDAKDGVLRIVVAQTGEVFEIKISVK